VIYPLPVDQRVAVAAEYRNADEKAPALINWQIQVAD